jgi:hypothetical protein
VSGDTGRREGPPDAPAATPTDPPAGDPEPDVQRGPELDVDAAFAAIVAGWSTPSAGPVGRWPASEDVDVEGEQRLAREARAREREAQRVEESRPQLRPDPRLIVPGEPVQELDEPQESERYVPPEPPPLPRGDLVSRLAWAGVLGGPVLLLLATVVWPSMPQWLLLCSLAAFVGGFVTLVSRMPARPPDDPDDGAVV